MQTLSYFLHFVCQSINIEWLGECMCASIFLCVCVCVCVGDVRVREVQSRWMAPSTGPVAACYPQQQVIKPPVYIPVCTTESLYYTWTNHNVIWIVFYLISVKLKSYFLLNFDDESFPLNLESGMDAMQALMRVFILLDSVQLPSTLRSLPVKKITERK